MTKTLNIHMGALCDSIPKQLKAQCFKFKADEARYFQRSIDQITTLKFADLLTEKEAKNAQDRLFNQIKAHVIQMNKPVKK